MPHLHLMSKHEDLRQVAMERLRAPMQAALWPACTLCANDIQYLRDEQRPAGPDGPVLCPSCVAQAERRVVKAQGMVARIESMAAPYGAHSLDTLTGAVLGYCAQQMECALSMEERVVFQIAAFRYWQSTHSRVAA
jgi:hypothetical protein